MKRIETVVDYWGVLEPADKNNMKRTCNECMFAFFVDYGYSNYTVEGTDFYCGVNQHPVAPFDRWYGGDKRLLYAEQCESFTKGKPVEMDVDRDNEDERMSVAQRIMWRHIRHQRVTKCPQRR